MCHLFKGHSYFAENEFLRVFCKLCVGFYWMRACSVRDRYLGSWVVHLHLQLEFQTNYSSFSCWILSKLPSYLWSRLQQILSILSLGNIQPTVPLSTMLSFPFLTSKPQVGILYKQVLSTHCSKIWKMSFCDYVKRHWASSAPTTQT